MRALIASVLFVLAGPASAQAPGAANAPPAPGSASGPAAGLAASADPVPDTTAPWRYYPLAIGNVWEYEYNGGLIKRETITGDTTALDQRYFIVRVQGFYEGEGPLESGGGRTALRYDTTTATVLALGDVSNEYPVSYPLDAPFGESEGGLVFVSGQADGVLVFGGEAPGTGTDTVRTSVKFYYTRTGFDTRYAADVGLALTEGEGGYQALTYYKVGGEEHGVSRFPTASEGAPDSPTVSVQAWPNPASRSVTVAVALAAPERVRVTVVDALGREVARVHDGPAADGARFSVETARLAPGAYRVRLTAASGASATAGLTVAR